VNELRTYEALYIVKPDVEDDQIQTIADKVIALVTENGGAIVRSEIWGKRRLAYEVKKFTEGCYVLLRFTAEPAFTAKLDNHFRYTEAVIKWLIVHFDEKMLRKEEEQRIRKEEEIRASAEEAKRREKRPFRDDDDDDDDDDITAPVGGSRRRRRDDDDDDDDDY
jgi:small subunit ribosomal protein S6